MDEYIIEKWNSVVGEHDKVYHLGDVFFGDGHKHLHRLKGKKRLIIGNHDNPLDERLTKHFEKVMMWRTFREWNCVCTHVPIHPDSMRKVDINLHGHIHEKPSPGPQYVNCSVELHDYTPKPIEELVKLAHI